MVYYLYTGKNGTEIKFAALVLARADDGVLIRVGRYDVDTKDVATFESLVDETSLQPRSVPCAYEDALKGKT